MQTDERLEKDFFPKLREKISEEFQATQFRTGQQQPNKRNFIIRLVITTKNLAENFVAFLLTIAFFIPLWLFKIGLNVLDMIERWIRFFIWLYVKVIIFIVNFVFKLLKFLGVTSAVNFIKKIVTTYLRTYIVEEPDKDLLQIKKGENFINKQDQELIDVKKIEKKIRTPNIFLSHQQNVRPTFSSPQRQQYRERINRDLIPERTVQQNIVETTSHRIKNPVLTSLNQSHQRLKRVATEPRINSSTNLEIEIPSINRQNTSPLSQSHRVEPDRDVSPQFYQRQNIKVTDSSFKKKETPEKQILLTHHHPIIQGTQNEKHELQIQLLNLRTKMSELIKDNNKDIHELEKWIQEKSLTITMTRKQNMELLQQIQELQRENIKKTNAFAEFEVKIIDMEKALEKQRNLKNGLNEKVQRLEEQIKIKTIEIMSLKQKIRTNFEHLQRMQSIFGNQRGEFEKSPFKDQYPLEIESPENLEVNSKSLISDLDQKQKDNHNSQQIQKNHRSQYQSNVKTIGQSVNEQQIEQLQQKAEIGSEKQIIEVPLLEAQDIQEVKSTSAVQQHVDQNLQQKILEEQKIVDRMIHKVQETLRRQQEKLQKFQQEKSVLLEQVLQKPKQFKETKLMQQEKLVQFLLQKEKEEEEVENEKETDTKETGEKKKKKNKKGKNR